MSMLCTQLFYDLRINTSVFLFLKCACCDNNCNFLPLASKSLPGTVGFARFDVFPKTWQDIVSSLHLTLLHRDAKNVKQRFDASNAGTAVLQIQYAGTGVATIRMAFSSQNSAFYFGAQQN